MNVTTSTLEASGAAKSGVASKSHLPRKRPKEKRFLNLVAIGYGFPRKLASTGTGSILPSRFAAKRRDYRIVVPQLRESLMAEGFSIRFRPLGTNEEGKDGNSARFHRCEPVC